MWLICLLYRRKYGNLKLAEDTMRRGPGSSEEVWQRSTNVGFNTQVLGSKLGISLYSYLYLKLAKMIKSFLLSPMFSLQQNQRTREAEEGRGRWPKQCE
jgi:hypothetical protein